MLPDILNYVPDPNNGRPLAGAKVYFMIGGYTAPINEYDFDVTKIAPITANGDVVPQPLYTSQGGTLWVGSQVNQPTLIPSGLTQKVAVYDKCGKLVYQVGYSAQGAFVSSSALAASNSSVLIAGMTASELVAKVNEVDPPEPDPSSGGGIIYDNVFPETIVPEDTYADFEKMELVFSYQDSNSVQYLAVPMLAGSGGSASSSGAVGYSTLTTADPVNSLVALGSTNEEHRIKAIKVGEGLTIVSTGTSLTLANPLNSVGTDLNGVSLVVNTDGSVLPTKYIRRIRAGTGVTFNTTTESITINSSGGGGGGGIVYSDNPPSTLVAGTTYANFDTMEFVFSYQDSNSLQYISVPMLAGAGGSAVSGGGSSITIANAGSVGDGSALLTNSGSNYFVRRLQPSAAQNCTITESGNSLIIEPTIFVNAGVTGAPLLKAKSVNTIGVKRLIAGTNVTLSEGVDAITINSSGGGGGSLNDSLTRINALTPVNNNMMVWTAAGVDNVPTTASTRAMLGLNTVPNTIPLFTGTSTATTTSLTPFMVGLLAATGKPSGLSTLGITSGSNANGGWLRIATGDTSGVQICFHAIICSGTSSASGSGFVGANATWNFPQSFNGLPAVSGSIQDGVQAWISNGTTGNSASSASFRQFSFVSGSGNAAVSVMAIGFY